MNQVLVVDDEPAVREVLIQFLNQHGYTAGAAEDGPSALAICAKDPPLVILLDIAMPGMNGLEALKRLRQVAPGSAVIMISGHADQEMALQALELGAYDFIQKPLDFQYLERTLLAKIVTLDHAAPSGSQGEVPDAGRRVGGRRGR